MSQNKSLTIAIIGGGFSGVMVAVHLLKHAKSPVTIKLIEPRAIIGQGVAYSTDKICHLLNVPAGQMSAFPLEPDHFLNWLQSQGFTEIQADSFAPRKLYGKYIRAVLDEAQANAEASLSLECWIDEAISIKVTSEKINIYLNGGEIIESDRVVLALGNFPSANPPINDTKFYNSKRYISWAWSKNCLTSVPFNEPVLLVGCGLTGLDIVTALHQQGHKGTINILSRRGLAPQAHKSTVAYQSFLKANQAPQTIRALFRLVRQEVESAEALGYDWRAVIDALRSETQEIWQGLPLPEKRRFFRHVRIYWDIHRHRVAPVIKQTLTELQTSGQVILHAGRIQAYDEDTDGVNVLVRKRSGQTQTLRAGFVINCTGPQSNYRKIEQPLILDLLASGIIRPHPLNLGLDVAANGTLIDSTGKASERIYTLGSTQIGHLWETIAVPEVREQAQVLAQKLLE